MGGKDKGLLARNGESLLSRSVRILQEAGAAQIVVAVGPEGARRRAYRAQLGASARLVADAGEGPLGGIVEGLAAATHPIVALLPVDTPDASAASVRELVRAFLAGRENSPDPLEALLPVVGGVEHPLNAVLLREPCHTRLARVLADGERSARAALGGLRTGRYHVGASAHYADVDTPEDWARATDGDARPRQPHGDKD